MKCITYRFHKILSGSYYLYAIILIFLIVASPLHLAMADNYSSLPRGYHAAPNNGAEILRRGSPENKFNVELSDFKAPGPDCLKPSTSHSTILPEDFIKILDIKEKERCIINILSTINSLPDKLKAIEEIGFRLIEVSSQGKYTFVKAIWAGRKITAPSITSYFYSMLVREWEVNITLDGRGRVIIVKINALSYLTL